MTTSGSSKFSRSLKRKRSEPSTSAGSNNPSANGVPPPESSTIAMIVEWWSIDRPIPYEKNARKWSAEAIQKIATSIKEFGWRQPIVCDVKDVIVIGHLRLAAARYLGYKQVPVHVARDLTELQIKALRLADNRTHEEAEWDHQLLGAELIDLKIAAIDLDLTGFEAHEIASSVFGGNKKRKKVGAGGNGWPIGASDGTFQIIVTCKDETDQGQLLERLAHDGYECRSLIS